jgi:hypothetical protein
MRVEIIHGGYVRQASVLFPNLPEPEELIRQLHKIRDSRNDRWAYARINGRRCDDDQIQSRLLGQKKKAPKKGASFFFTTLMVFSSTLLSPSPHRGFQALDRPLVLRRSRQDQFPAPLEPVPALR